uniref:Peptidase S1 domain-containing protein n=1 Tax=Oreochromis niloticus TaxID=8128 RepID=A0A669EQ20_ORENI
ELLHSFLLLLFLNLYIPLLSGFTVCTEVDLHKRIFHDHSCEKNDSLYYVQIIQTNRTHYSHLCGEMTVSLKTTTTKKNRIHPGPGREVTITDHKIFENQTEKHDIMLLKINPPENKIKPCLISLYETRSSFCFLKFFSLVPGKPPHLQCAKMHVVKCGLNLTPCNSTLLWPNGNTMCYKEPRVDTCPGDSGGGVIYNNTIYGVHVGGKQCACKGPATSLKVCSYIHWIMPFITPNNGK